MSEVADWFHKNIWQTIVDNDLPVPSEPTMNIMLSVGLQLYDIAEEEIAEGLSLRWGRPKRHPANSTHANALLYWVKANILHMLYHTVRRLPKTDGPFLVPLIRAVPAPSFIYDLTQPLRVLGAETVPTLQDVLKRFNVNMALITEEFQHKKEFRTTDVMTPQRYPKKDFERYLAGTPLLPLAELLVPYQPFSEINRCAHHWCLGKTRRGKTTFLRHLIRYDLGQVAKGECSLVVIDSKTLIREMRTLKQFAHGEPLDEKLILIDSDDPFPLNPFHLPREQARSVLLYMLGNLSDASQLQSGALGFYIDAALQSTNPSLQTILDYMRLKGGKTPEVPRELSRFDKATQEWFLKTRPGLHTATSGGIEQRLANFMREHAHTPFYKMLTADSWALDLYNELHHGGKVLLVDTDWQRNGAEGANLMGRLFIALIEQLATKRMKAPSKPVWVYIDEASDYLTNDENFVQIMIKAAAAKVGVTVAYQYKGLIDQRIEKALENAEIHSECIERGVVELSIEEKPQTLRIPPLEFTHEPQMLPDEYRYLREWLRWKYPYTVAPPPKTDEQPLTQKF